MKKLKYSLVFLSFVCLLGLPACESSQGPTTTVDDVYLHVRAGWSPDGKSIAFTSFVQNAEGVYVMDSLGGNIRQIVQGEGVGLTWSPDSRWVAFYRVNALYKVKANGDSLMLLTDVIAAIRPAWSRDGSKIAFVDRDRGQGIWLYDVNKGTASSFLSYGNFPSWHPTSGELVVLFAQVNQSTGLMIYDFIAVNISNFAARTLGSFTTAADCGFSPISPTGNTIVYGLKRPDDYAQIWLYDIVLSRHTKLTDDGGDFPAWSPDGTKIVYSRTQAGDGGLWVMNADGSNKRRLTKP